MKPLSLSVVCSRLFTTCCVLLGFNFAALQVMARLQTQAAPLSAQAAAQPEQPNGMLTEGAALMAKGQLAEARSRFQRVLQIDPNNAVAHTYLGVVAAQEGKLTEAESHFSAAVIADPFSPAVHNNYGAVLVRLGRKKQAALQFAVSLKLNPNQRSALVNLAEIRYAEGTTESLQTARGLFERAAALGPDVQVSLALIVTALRLKDPASAAKYYHTYHEQVTAAPSRAPSFAARTILGAALIEGGLVNEASEELTSVVAKDPGNVRAIITLSRALVKQNQVAPAVSVLESAVSRGLENAPVYAALAEVYEKSGQADKAIEAMRKAVERDQKREEYRFRYGMLLTESKAPADGRSALETALTDFPRSSRLWFALGVSQLGEHRTADAVASFNHALEIDPKFAQALAYLGMAAAEEGRYGDAVSYYERSLAIDDNVAATHYLLAEALLKQQPVDNSRVESHLTRAVALDASFAPVRLALGKLDYRLNRFPEAAEQLQRAIELNPNLAEAHSELAEVYRRLKRSDDSHAERAISKRLNDTKKEQAELDRREIVRKLANVRF